MSYVLIGDSDSDFPASLVDRFSLPMIYMPYLLNGEERFPDLGRDPANLKNFYAEMRSGATAKTSLLPEAAYVDYFEPYLQRGNDILYIAFSYQLSQTQVNAEQAAKALMEQYPGRTIRVLDTKSISMGYGLLLYEACKQYEQGRTMDEIAEFVLSHAQRAHHWFTVDDLVYLRRGGRLSATSAFMGTVLDIKPMLTLNREGKIVPVGKVKGRRKAMRALVDATCEHIDQPQERTVVILNADCPADALTLEQLLRERMQPKEVMHAPVGEVIGAHCGPGTLAIVHLGKERTE